MILYFQHKNITVSLNIISRIAATQRVALQI